MAKKNGSGPTHPRSNPLPFRPQIEWTVIETGMISVQSLHLVIEYHHPRPKWSAIFIHRMDYTFSIGNDAGAAPQWQIHFRTDGQSDVRFWINNRIRIKNRSRWLTRPLCWPVGRIGNVWSLRSLTMSPQWRSPCKSRHCRCWSTTTPFVSPFHSIEKCKLNSDRPIWSYFSAIDYLSNDKKSQYLSLSISEVNLQTRIERIL